MAGQNNLTITLQQLDGTNTVMARRTETFSYPVPLVGMGEWRVGNLVDTAAKSISLVGLVPQPLQLICKHTGTTGTITVIWTPTGGASATILVLNPLDMIAFWQITTAVGAGISALSLTASVANTPFELFIGG